MVRVGSILWSESYSHKPHTRDDEYIDAFDPAPPGSGLLLKIINYLFVVGSIAVMIYYTTVIVSQLQEDQREPPTTTLWTGLGGNDDYTLVFPEMIICPSIPNTPLTYYSCNQDEYSTKKKKEDVWDCYEKPSASSNLTFRQISFSPDLEDERLNYTCWLVNGPGLTKAQYLTARYSGSQNDIWIQLFMNWEDIGNQTQNWVGLYILFLEAGTDYVANGITISDVMNAACVVSGGVVNVVSLQKFIQQGWGQPKQTYYNFDVNSAPWGPGTFSGESGSPYSYYAISISFSDLAVQTITQKPAYTIANLLGDFSGMLGVLVGIDLLKIILLISLFPKLIVAIHRKMTGQSSPEEAKA